MASAGSHGPRCPFSRPVTEGSASPAGLVLEPCQRQRTRAHGAREGRAAAAEDRPEVLEGRASGVAGAHVPWRMCCSEQIVAVRGGLAFGGTRTLAGLPLLTTSWRGFAVRALPACGGFPRDA